MRRVRKEKIRKMGAELWLRELRAYSAYSAVKKQKINHRVRKECAEKKLGKGAGGSANSAPTPRTLRLEKNHNRQNK